MSLKYARRSCQPISLADHAPGLNTNKTIQMGGIRGEVCYVLEMVLVQVHMQEQS